MLIQFLFESRNFNWITTIFKALVVIINQLTGRIIEIVNINTCKLNKILDIEVNKIISYAISAQFILCLHINANLIYFPSIETLIFASTM